MLTAGTIEGGASALADAPYRSATAAARFASPVVDRALDLKVTGAAVAVQVVADAAAPGGNGRRKRRANGFGQHGATFPPDAIGRAQG